MHRMVRIADRSDFSSNITSPSWQPLVDHYLSRFRSKEGVPLSDVDALEAWAANATAFDATGSWRMRLIDGTLWVKPLRFHAHWAERANVLRMMLLATRASKRLPTNLDLVYGHADNDNTPTRDVQGRRQCLGFRSRPPKRAAEDPADGASSMRPSCDASCRATWRDSSCVPLPLFTNSHDPKRGGLPVPEFTWIGWQKVPPWCQQVVALDAAAEATPWTARDRRLFFSGGLDNGHHRKELRR